MKECPNCKAKNRDDAAFCTECGTDLKEVAAQTDEWAAAAGDFLNKAKEAAATGAKKAKAAAVVGAQKAKEAASSGAEKVQKAVEEADKKMEAAKAERAVSGGWDSAVEVQAGSAGSAKGTAAMFVDQSESVVSTIGNNYLQNFLLGGEVKKGIGVLTLKRFYFKGKNFNTEKEGGLFAFIKSLTSTTEEGVVSIDDISLTQFTYTRHTGFLLLAILLLVVGLPLLPLGAAIGVVFLVAALFFFVKYFLDRQTLFVVYFPGGSFGFDVKYYPIADIRDFQRQLHLLKDHIKEEERR